MSKRYRITVTEEQLAGLKHAVCSTQVKFEHAIPKHQEAVEWLEKKPDDYPEKARYLAMGKETLKDAREKSRNVSAAISAVYSAKLIPSSRRPARRRP